MFLSKVISLACLVALGNCQDYEDHYPSNRPVRLGGGSEAPKPTPVAILKQINRHNEDGSYTYGYEGADGSFKIETKLATGEVKGKYGYTDETGKVRIVEYGANKYGFQPSGEGITVAPPTLVDETTDKNGRRIVDDYEDEQQAPAPKYRPQPKQPRPAAPPQQYYEYEQVQEPRPRVSAAPAPPRLQIPGAAPVPPRPQIPGAAPAAPRFELQNVNPAHSLDIVYAPRSRPARIEPDYEDVGPQTFPQPAQQRPSQLFTSVAPSRPKAKAQYQPEPVQYLQQQQQQQQPAPRAHHPQQGTSSLLDQLAKDYALPQGGSHALHDISFGYY